jgi:RNA recognition motif-containing protein
MPSFSSEQLRKIFIGGLNLETTEETLKDYFSRWGECVDVVVMRHSDTGKPRGFGFVTYEKVESVDAVLTVKSHILDDKKIDPKRAVAREQASHSTKQEDEKNRENQRVFVGGLASATTEDDVRECFTKFCYEVGYGRVQDIEIMRNREDGKCRGFCFVTFHSDTDIVDRVCAEKYFEIINKAVEVRRAESRLAMMERKGRGQDIDRRRMADCRRDANYSYQGGCLAIDPTCVYLRGSCFMCESIPTVITPPPPGRTSGNLTFQKNMVKFRTVRAKPIVKFPTVQAKNIVKCPYLPRTFPIHLQFI